MKFFLYTTLAISSMSFSSSSPLEAREMSPGNDASNQQNIMPMHMSNNKTTMDNTLGSETTTDYAICRMTSEKNCSLDYLRKNQGDKLGWIIYPGGETKCNDGSEYAFQVFPSISTNKFTSGSNSSKVFLWFQGGGACYDYVTCLQLPVALRNGDIFMGNVTKSLSLLPKRPSKKVSNLFQDLTSDLPFTAAGTESDVDLLGLNVDNFDINITDVDIDIVNDTVITMENASESIVSAFKKQKVYFNGAKNTLSVLSWMDKNFQNVNANNIDTVNHISDEKVPSDTHHQQSTTLNNETRSEEEFGSLTSLRIGGCSAGSLGLQLWADYLVNKYDVESIVLDSYIGIFTRKIGAVLKFWDVCQVGEKTMGWSKALVRKCNRGNLSRVSDVFGKTLATTKKEGKKTKFTYIGSKLDIIQRAFYVITSSNNYLDFPFYYQSFLTVTSEFPWKLPLQLRKYATMNDNFSSYTVKGTQHCFLCFDIIYDQYQNVLDH
eukprot:Awhi_evm1s6003